MNISFTMDFSHPVMNQSESIHFFGCISNVEKFTYLVLEKITHMGTNVAERTENLKSLAISKIAKTENVPQSEPPLSCFQKPKGIRRNGRSIYL